MATPYQDLEVTHRGLHRFIPRHADEIQIGIGDPIHVIKEYDDLWCEGQLYLISLLLLVIGDPVHVIKEYSDLCLTVFFSAIIIACQRGPTPSQTHDAINALYQKEPT